jgi:acetoin utilization deacetylase AcuC-like enzyme
VVNLHGDPASEYPFFLGYVDETGAGKGEGFNVNYPMPAGTTFDAWAAALEEGCRKIASYQPEVLLVSLGVDTFEKDPISAFKLRTEHYPLIGARIARLALPTLFLLEGGYAVAEIAVNAVGVLTGFEGG